MGGSDRADGATGDTYLRARNTTRGVVLAERVLVAETSETRKRGLLGRERFEAGEGLWLVPCEWVHMFGMRFAIDIVVLDAQEKVVGVQENLRPGWIGKLFWGAHSTLELPVGTVRASGTTKGDRIAWEGVGAGDAGGAGAGDGGAGGGGMDRPA
jgi:uncharacterized membrane protein (UPF0127 family)